MLLSNAPILRAAARLTGTTLLLVPKLIQEPSRPVPNQMPEPNMVPVRGWGYTAIRVVSHLCPRSIRRFRTLAWNRGRARSGGHRHLFFGFADGLPGAPCSVLRYWGLRRRTSVLAVFFRKPVAGMCRVFRIKGSDFSKSAPPWRAPAICRRRAHNQRAISRALRRRILVTHAAKCRLASRSRHPASHQPPRVSRPTPDAVGQDSLSPAVTRRPIAPRVSVGWFLVWDRRPKSGQCVWGGILSRRPIFNGPWGRSPPACN